MVSSSSMRLPACSLNATILILIVYVTLTQCVGGYFIKAVNLPRFWYYWAHFIDYQVCPSSELISCQTYAIAASRRTA